MGRNIIAARKTPADISHGRWLVTNKYVRDLLHERYASPAKIVSRIEDAQIGSIALSLKNLRGWELKSLIRSNLQPTGDSHNGAPFI
jgi:hypothetical protein